MFKTCQNGFFSLLGKTVMAFLLLAISFMAGASTQGHAEKHTQYTFVDLGTLGGPTSDFTNPGFALNNSGTATGVADTPNHDTHAFKWHNGVMTDLGTLPGGGNSFGISINSYGAIGGAAFLGPDFVTTLWRPDGQIVNLGTLGGARSLPNAISNRGQIVGGATNRIRDQDRLGEALGIDLPFATQIHAALWQNGTIRDLGTLGTGKGSFAYFVNQHGEVAGDSTTNSLINPTTGFPTTAPFFWKKGRMVNLGTFGGTKGNALSLNNRGQVVGVSLLAGDENADKMFLGGHAFLWEQGHMKDLGTLGGCCAVANWINDAGDIVGISNLPGDDQPFHAVLWRRGVITDLGSLCPGSDSNAFVINARSQVVGISGPCAGAVPAHPVLWENGGPAIDLNTFVPSSSDLILTWVYTINDSGVIAVPGVLPNGNVHAVLLIPRENAAHGSDAATVTPGLSRRAHAGWTPEQLARLRARYTNRPRGFGRMLPKKSN